MKIQKSYHLSSQTTISRAKFSKDAWAKVLSLAMFYGWQPMGTRAPDIIELYDTDVEDWDGTYLANEGQTVIAEDALSLAIALEKALDDIPDFSIEIDRATRFRKENDLLEELSPIEKAILEAGLEHHLLELVEINPFEYFAGDRKRHLIDFIKFCRLGSFTVL